jgi:hypothetical protein
VGWVDPDGTQGIIKAQNAHMWSEAGFRRHMAQGEIMSDAEYKRRQSNLQAAWAQQHLKDSNEYAANAIGMMCPEGGLERIAQEELWAGAIALRNRWLAAKAAKLLAEERHHYLAKQFGWFFKRAGLNIEDYTVMLERNLHKVIHGKGGGEAYLNSWNKVWERWINANLKASPAAILQQMTEMRKQFGI